MKGIIAPALELLPPKFAFRLFVVLLDPVASVRILEERLERRGHGGVAPEVLVLPHLPASGPLPDQPADVAGAVAIHPPRAQRAHLGPLPSATP